MATAMRVADGKTQGRVSLAKDQERCHLQASARFAPPGRNHGLRWAGRRGGAYTPASSQSDFAFGEISPGGFAPNFWSDSAWNSESEQAHISGNLASGQIDRFDTPAIGPTAYPGGGV